MPNSSSVTPWQLTMPAGSLQEWLFTFTIPSTGAPYPIAGFTWEYVARLTPVDLSVPPLISITPAGNSQGILTVTSTATVSSVLLEMYAPATVTLDGEYAHTLWANPGTNGAFSWVSGALLVEGNAQP